MTDHEANWSMLRCARSNTWKWTCVGAVRPVGREKRRAVYFNTWARQGKPRTVYSGGVPELSRFFGIIIRMFMEIGAPHHRPHFHAAYQDAKAVFALDPIECIGGELPRTQQRLVEAWAEIHRAELLQAWARLQSGRPPLKIEPLH